jgi:hypothetical protein
MKNPAECKTKAAITSENADRTSRNAANIVACAIGIAVVIMVSPAAADTTKVEVDVPQAQLIGACARTAGCTWGVMNPEGNGTMIVGCSPTACFSCDGSTCHSMDVVKGGQHPVGHVPVGQTDGVAHLLGASTTRPAAVNASTKRRGANQRLANPKFVPQQRLANPKDVSQQRLANPKDVPQASRR